MGGSGGSKQESKTVYEPGKKTLTQSYTPLYIQQAMADQADVSGRNLELARQAYAQTIANLNIAPGAGFKAPVTPKYEVFSASKYLPSEEFLNLGQQTIDEEKKRREARQAEKDREAEREAERDRYLVASAKTGWPMSRMMRGGGLF